jgi:hypothetical protein
MAFAAVPWVKTGADFDVKIVLADYYVSAFRYCPLWYLLKQAV